MKMLVKQKEISPARPSVVREDYWGARAREWADIQEKTARPLYESALAAAGVEKGTVMLDIGCGAGLAVQMAVKRGAKVTGFDASPGLLAVAEEKSPECEFHIGTMEELPFLDSSFDVVTGFNSFQFAGNPLDAFKEACRVASPEGRVVVAIWGRPEDCDAAAFLGAMRDLIPSAQPTGGGPFAYLEDGVLEKLCREAGLEPIGVEDIKCPFEYQDLATALSGLMSAGPAIMAMQQSGEKAVRDAVIRVLAPFKTESGGYMLMNKFRYVVARRIA
jgi:ubiquinone/menaquinone biosynthesis C-methylase UbiE